MSGTRKMDKFEVEALASDLPAADVARAPAPGDGVAVGLPADTTREAGARVDPDETPELPAVAFAAAALDDLPALASSSTGGAWVPGEWVPPQAEAAGDTAPEVGVPGDVDALRTRLARKFVTLADSVTESFQESMIGPGEWAVELTAPQGMSTGGGKQALQHLRLRPRREGFSVLVAGTVNPIERRAELRDFDHLAILHEVRFRKPLEIPRTEWEQFLRKAEVVLNAAGIQSMRTPPPRDLLEQRRSMQRVSRGAIAALVVVLLLAAVVVWRVIAALSVAS